MKKGRLVADGCEQGHTQSVTRLAKTLQEAGKKTPPQCPNPRCACDVTRVWRRGKGQLGRKGEGMLRKWVHGVVEWRVWRQQAALRWETYPKGCQCQCDDYFSASRWWRRRADRKLKSGRGAAERTSRTSQRSLKMRPQETLHGRRPARGATERRLMRGGGLLLGLDARVRPESRGSALRVGTATLLDREKGQRGQRGHREAPVESEPEPEPGHQQPFVEAQLALAYNLTTLQPSQPQ